MILQETHHAHHYRQLWRGLAEITQAANLPASGIFDAFGVWYATTQTSSVRRQLDRRRDTVSLRRLLDDIAQHPRVASRERHIAVWLRKGPDPQLEADAHENFDRFAGGRDRDHVDAAGVRADIERLEAAGSVVEKYAHEAVAHTAAEQTHEVPTFDELNRAIDQIGELAQKYASLLKAVMIARLEPVIQYDWKAPFRQPWIPPEADDQPGRSAGPNSRRARMLPRACPGLAGT